jgi:hypothetical protein
VQSSFNYTVFLNDGHSHTYHVEAVARPAVTKLDCTQVYPAYTHLPPQLMNAGELSLLAGSRLKLGITANKPLKNSNDIKDNHLHFRGSEVDVPLVADPANARQLITRDGQLDSIAVPANTTGMYVELVDTTGLRSLQPTVYAIELTPDRPPTIKLTYPDQHDITATTAATINIGIDGSDDFGIGSLKVRYTVTRAGSTSGPEATRDITLDLQGQTPQVVHRQFPWVLASLQPPVAAGDTIDFWVEAQDLNNVTGPGVGQSDHCSIKILTAEQKRQELLSRFNEYLGQVNDVSENQRDLASKLGAVIQQK